MINKKEMVCYEIDASRLKGSVKKIFFPETIKEVQQIIKNSTEDIVPRGAGTNLVGGCVPNNSIVVDLTKMNRVTNFSLSRKTVRVEPGVSLKELNEKLNPFELEFPIDVYNKNSTIGGMIARNVSGDRGMRYGSIKDWLEEIEFVNGKGELIKTTKVDLGEVCGMEGLTGIIVGATIRLAPLIKRTLSAFHSSDLDEVLSIARGLRNEKEVVIIELFSPLVSKLLGMEEVYNLIIEFNSDRGKVKGKDYEEITKIRENVFLKMFSEGYYNVEDPKFFFDKLKDFIKFLDENKIPYIGHLGSGFIHPFFKDEERLKKEKVIGYIKKIGAFPGKFGIGLTKKDLIDSFQRKVIERIKLKHDPLLRFNKGKVIDIESVIKKVETEEKIEKEIIGEEMTASEVLEEIYKKNSEDKNLKKEAVQEENHLSSEKESSDNLEEKVEVKKEENNDSKKDFQRGKLTEDEKNLINKIIGNRYNELKNRENENGS